MAGMKGSFIKRHAPPKQKINDWMVKKGWDITSQGGEDGVIDQVMSMLKTVVSLSHTCVEFGVRIEHT